MSFYILKIITLLGGLALFLFGMDVMGNSLEKLAGGRMQTILAKMSSNVPKGFLLGLAVTAVLMPMNRLLEKLAYLTIPAEPVHQKPVLLDDLLLATPAVAVQR